MSGIVSLYYQSDHDVQEDEELHAWLSDVSQEGFKELPNFGWVFYMFSIFIVISFYSISVLFVSAPSTC